MESIFFWLARLNPLVGPPTDLNYTKSKSYSRNNNLSNRIDINKGEDISNRINNKVLQTDRLFLTNPNQTEIESYSDYYDIYKIVGKKIFFIEDIYPNHSNPSYFKSEYYSKDIIENNHNIENGLGFKEFWLDNFEGPEQLDLYSLQQLELNLS